MTNLEPVPRIVKKPIAESKSEKQQQQRKYWLREAVQKTGFGSEAEARQYVVAAGREVDIVCPTKRKGFVRLLHRTAPRLAEMIGVQGLDYSNQGMISSTATTEEISLLGGDERFRLQSAVVIDIPEKESKIHDNVRLSPGRVKASEIAGVIHIGQSRERVSNLPIEVRAALLLPNTEKINSNTELGRAYIDRVATAINTNALPDYSNTDECARWVLDTLTTLGYDIKTEVDEKGMVHVKSFQQKEFPIKPPTQEEINEWRLEAVRDLLKQNIEQGIQPSPIQQNVNMGSHGVNILKINVTEPSNSTASDVW